MSTVIDLTATVGELVARQPSLSRVFEQVGVDYCCGGKRPLAEACRQKGLDPMEVAARLEQEAARLDDNEYVDAAAMSLTDLANHVEATHHAYLKQELPRLAQLTTKVATVHGAKDSRLGEIARIYAEFAADLSSHMMKEEQILFPMIRQIDVATAPMSFHCGSLANPIGQMEHEHHGAGDALEQFRALTDDYTPPLDACNTYRAMVDGLARLERDMHQHVHKEDNVLFPRAMAREAELNK